MRAAAAREGGTPSGSPPGQTNRLLRHKKRKGRLERKPKLMGPVVPILFLQALLVGTKIKLDCGHYSTIGHSFANTIIIVSVGGGKIETYCHNCGY